MNISRLIAIFNCICIQISSAKFLQIENAEFYIDSGKLKNLKFIIKHFLMPIKEYLKIDHQFEVVDGLNTVNLDIEVLKDGEGLVYQANVFLKNDLNYSQYYKTEVENDCNDETINDPILNFILKETKKYGNITEVCPLKKGRYIMKNFKIDSDDLPHQLSAGSYRFEFIAFIDKNGNLHNIYTAKYYFTT